MAHPITEGDKRGDESNKLRARTILGLTSEITLIAGIAFLGAAFVKIQRDGALLDCAKCVIYNVYDSPYLFWSFFNLFYVGVILLVASSIGFAFALWNSRKTSKTRSGTAS